MRVTLSALAVAAIFTTVQSTPARVVCYYVSWAQYRPDRGSYSVADIPVSQCTHVIYGYAGITNDTNIMLVIDYELDVQYNGYLNFTSLRSQYPYIKFMIGLGGWSEGEYKYSEMLSHKASRTNLTNSIVYFLNFFNFDGIDLDFEYPGDPDRGGLPTDKVKYLRFVQQLRTAFNQAGKGWELTATVPLVRSNVNDGYRVSELCQLFDAVHVSGYDLRGYWDGVVDVHSPLYNRTGDIDPHKNVNSGLHYWESKGCPANKLVVGIPFYGRTFTLNDTSSLYDIGSSINTTVGSGSAGPYTGEEGSLAYYEICTLVDAKNSVWTKGWAQQGMCPYAYSGNQWIGYENTSSLEIKMNWIKKRGYLGAMTWSIDMDDFHGLCGVKNPLLNVLYTHMSNYIVPTPAVVNIANLTLGDDYDDDGDDD